MTDVSTKPVLQRLDDLANKILDDALDNDVELGERLEAFKHLSAHYRRPSKKDDERPPEDTGQTFDRMRESIEQAGNGDRT